jgi:F-type H+-transporting ATPase subunit alpha
MLSYLAPYNGTAIVEYLRDNGYDAIICYDDFSKHAKTYRQISLIQGRVPGRDAYPADVFNLHAGLLERAGATKTICGNGSITAFPIVETINCDVTEYIATNLISITDGQIYTNANLFKNGLRPAVDSALSVSRVGSSAQFTYYKRLVGTIKNDLTNYRQYLESSFVEDEETSYLRLKGIAIQCIYYQD